MRRSPMVVAIVSLAPDRGHVIPLLRIGAALQRAGVRVVCFLPDGCRDLRSQYSLELRAEGPEVSRETSALAARFMHSSAGRATIAYSLLRYFAAVRRDAARALGRLRGALDELAPEVVLADPHGFRTWYRYLANSCGADLVLHEAEGTLRAWQALPVQLRGLAPPSRLGAMLHHGLAYLERAAARSVERTLRWCTRAGWPEHPQTLAYVAAALGLPAAAAQERALRPFRASPITLSTAPARGDDAPAGYQELVMTTGIAPLEAREQREGLVVPGGVAWFGPLQGAASSLPEDLERWLSAGGRVVYISFGTMLRVTRALLRSVSAALAALGLRGLWAIPSSHATELAGAVTPSHLRIEPHVPQVAVLRRPEVACCITHAGAGTVQESLWAGKPLLCVPALWDQFYNASWVVSRGAGLCISPHRAKSQALRRALTALLHEPTYAAAARQLALAFAEARGEERVVDFIQRVCDARRARRSSAPGAPLLG